MLPLEALSFQHYFPAKWKKSLLLLIRASKSGFKKKTKIHCAGRTKPFKVKREKDAIFVVKSQRKSSICFVEKLNSLAYKCIT